MSEKREKEYPASVVKILDDYDLVINKGTAHGVKIDQRFLIYELSEEEIHDPVTEEPLGHLEIVKGTGKVIHAQDKMATIRSDMKEFERTIIKRKNPIFPLAFEEEKITSPELQPFDSPKIRDRAKPVG